MCLKLKADELEQNIKGESSGSDFNNLSSPGVRGHLFTRCSINKARFTLFLQSLNVKYGAFYSFCVETSSVEK